MSGPYDYYLGAVPWVQPDTTEDDPAPAGWYAAPADCVGWIDLRTIAQQATPENGGGVGFFALPEGAVAPVGWSLLATGDLREIASTAAMRDAWEAATGYRPAGVNLVDLLADQLTQYVDGSPAILPGVNGEIVLHLGGHSRIWSHQVNGTADPYWGRLRTFYGRRLSEARTAARAGRLISPVTRQPDLAYHRRIADKLLEKLAVMGITDFESVRPAGWPRGETPLPHATTLTDNFDDADSTTLASHTPSGGVGNWTQVSGTHSITSNTLRSSSAGSGRLEADLAGDDHECELTITITTTSTARDAGPCARFNSSAHTCYYARQIGGAANAGDYQLCKIVTGTVTALGSTHSGTTITASKKVKCDGGTISIYSGGSLVEDVSDGSISGTTRVGERIVTTSSTVFGLNDLTAADLTAGTFTGTAAVTCGAATCSGSAEFDAPVYSATAAVTVGRATCSGAAEFDAPVYSAAATVSVAGATCAGSAEFDAPVYSGAVSVTVAGATCAGVATSDESVSVATASLTVAAAVCAGLVEFVESEIVAVAFAEFALAQRSATLTLAQRSATFNIAQRSADLTFSRT